MKKLFTFISAIIISGSLNAQIPNNCFATWAMVSGYNNPTGWDNLNSMTSSMSTYTCVQGTPGVTPCASYLQLTSKTVSGMGVMPGVATCGVLDMTTFMPKKGFASTVRPVSLTGSWQYMAFGADQGHIMVLLTKWNTAMNMRDTLAFANQPLSGMAMSWATFTIPLTYHSSAVPDSAIILLSASGSTPVNNSYLYVDNLAFTGTVTTGVANIANNSSVTSVYPNPATGNTTITYNSTTENTFNIFISDMNGRNIITQTSKVVAGENKFPINVSNLAKGIYFINTTNGQNTQVQKLVIE